MCFSPTVPDGDSMIFKDLSQPKQFNDCSVYFCLLPKQVSWFISGRLEVQFFQDLSLKFVTAYNPYWEPI